MTGHFLSGLFIGWAHRIISYYPGSYTSYFSLHMMDQSKKGSIQQYEGVFAGTPPGPSVPYKYEWGLTWEMERLIDVDIKFGSELLPTPSGLDSVAT